MTVPAASFKKPRRDISFWTTDSNGFVILTASLYAVKLPSVYGRNIKEKYGICKNTVNHCIFTQIFLFSYEILTGSG